MTVSHSLPLLLTLTLSLSLTLTPSLNLALTLSHCHSFTLSLTLTHSLSLTLSRTQSHFHSHSLTLSHSLTHFQEASVHPSSVNSKLNGDEWISPYIVFHERVQTTKVNPTCQTPLLRGARPLSKTVTILLQGGRDPHIVGLAVIFFRERVQITKVHQPPLLGGGGDSRGLRSPLKRVATPSKGGRDPHIGVTRNGNE